MNNTTPPVNVYNQNWRPAGPLPPSGPNSPETSPVLGRHAEQLASPMPSAPPLDSGYSADLPALTDSKLGGYTPEWQERCRQEREDAKLAAKLQAQEVALRRRKSVAKKREVIAPVVTKTVRYETGLIYETGKVVLYLSVAASAFLILKWLTSGPIKEYSDIAVLFAGILLLMFLLVTAILGCCCMSCGKTKVVDLHTKNA